MLIFSSFYVHIIRALFIKLVLALFFKRQEHRKLSWLDKDSDKDQSQFDELFN
jgi:hypothetical protein